MKKRVLSMLCAVMMLCCMAGTAMAAETAEIVSEETKPLTEFLEQAAPEGSRIRGAPRCRSPGHPP